MTASRSTRFSRRLENGARPEEAFPMSLEILGLIVVALIILIVLSIPVIFHGLNHSEDDVFKHIAGIHYPNITCSNSIDSAAVPNCSRDFYLYKYDNDTKFCHPCCHSWSHYSRSVALSLRVLEGLTAGLGICFSIATLVISGLRYKIIFTFPAIFIIYAAISYAIRDSLFLISSLAGTNLYCSSDDLFHTAEHPTAFCFISGVINQYTSVIVTYWWLCLIGMTFFKLVCPFQARLIRVQGYHRHIHILMVIIGVFFPVPGVMAALAAGEYNIDAFPPLICLANNPDIHFYSTTFINILLTSVYSILLIFITWIIHKHEGLFNSRNVMGFNMKFTTTEKKLVFIFFLNLFFGLISFANSAVYSAQKNEFEKAAIVYFRCELCGIQANGQSCDRQDIERFLSSILVWLFEISNALLPLGPLIYVTNWSTLKASLIKCHRAKKGSPHVELIVIKSPVTHAIDTSGTDLVNGSSAVKVNSSSSSSSCICTSKDVLVEQLE